MPIIDAVEIFTKPFPGTDCPICGTETLLLGTLNEWRYYCKKCNKRFNNNKEEYKD